MIELKNTCFKYNGDRSDGGLKDINLTVKQGEVVLLCGESGCGKTTLIRLINGLIPNYYEGELSGDVLIKGNSINGLPLYETANLVGSVFQNPRSQFFNVDTTSELAFGCENKGLPPSEIENRISETVEGMHIQSLLGRSIFDLSGGEKQKIACASVAALYPEIFVLDEPSSNLDTQAIDKLRLFIEDWKRQGKTVVIAEHRLYFLHELADRIVYMKDGTIHSEYSNEQMRQMDNAALIKMGLRPMNLAQLARKENKTTGIENISLTDFTFSYKNQSLVINISSLEVPKGSIIAIIGNNGTGKSTFARCLCGLEKRCRGVMDYCGRKWNGKQRLKCCYMVMQDVNHQLFTESVLDEVLLSMNQQSEQKSKEILEDLDLQDFQERHPMSLSGGQKQRVAIASAIASEREIVVFDEPTSGLDLRHMQEVADVLGQLQSLGKTQFIITHDIELILECCTYIVHLHDGEVKETYPLDDAGVKKLLDFFVI